MKCLCYISLVGGIQRYDNSLVLICGVAINVNGQSIKRYPLNILVFGFQGGARMFLMLFLFEYFQTSKFILVNMMFVSILGYLRFKTEQ